jgi:hypothetical protein
MGKPPTASPKTEGRTFDTDWSIANVAKLLRSNAERGMWRDAGPGGGGIAAVNQSYLRTVSARHRPTSVSLIFMRLEQEACWYASLCFSDPEGYLPWNSEAAEQWLCALFGENRPRVLGDTDTGSVRQFRVPTT